MPVLVEESSSGFGLAVLAVLAVVCVSSKATIPTKEAESWPWILLTYEYSHYIIIGSYIHPFMQVSCHIYWAWG